MKKLALILMLFVLALGVIALNACGEKEDDKAGSATTAEAGGGEEPTPAPTPAPTPEPTEPPTTTEPPPPKEYEILKRFTFSGDTDDRDEIGWGKRQLNHIENFRVEGGILKMTSVGGDPFFGNSVPLDIDAAEIDVIRIKVRNMADDGRCQLFFDTDTQPGLAEDKSYKEDYWEYGPDNDKWEEVMIYPKDNDLWEGKVNIIRFDPAHTEGEIWIEFISFEKEKK